MSDSISIKGARVHNLKNIDIEIPLNKIVAFTGVSGSGKSSIAKDIIYSEGQRRYLDCLSPYARQFIKGLERPDIDEIRNILPTVCVHQHTFQPGSLSTMGTVSEVYNFLRLLYAKTGDTYCPDHPDQKIDIFSAEKIAVEIKALGNKQVKILAPVVKLKKGNHKAVFERARASEISEVRCDRVFARPGFFEEGLEKSKVHSIDFVLGKFVPQNIDSEIIIEVVNQALALGGGELIVHADNKDLIYSSERSCPKCKRGFFKADPEDLSFHSKRGRCKKCGGTGALKGKTCPECDGTRLNEIGRNIRINSENIFEICNASPARLIEKIRRLNLSENARIIGEPVIKELLAKLTTLSAMGLDHLTLNRDCHTLSGGELQRLRLATAMGSPLSGVLYIFDEPSIGLHPFDNRKVLGKLSELNEKGNSVIIIEHDEDSIMFADHIIEVGPGGGAEGGTIIFNDVADKFKDHFESYELDQSGSKSKDTNGTGRSNFIKLKNCSKNTVKDVSLAIPTQNLVCIAGLSGTGKSTLVHEIIFNSLNDGTEKAVSGDRAIYTYENNTLELDKKFAKVIQIDQAPIGSTSRSTPASYLGIWDEMRKLYANTIEAKTQGWTASKFSYNSGDGRCPDCKGLGVIKLEMNFLADAKIHCETCNGKRYKDEIQAVKFSGLSISDVLGLTFSEAKEKFYHHRKVHRAIFTACELGLGYLTLGQSSNSLSGGEAQRLKLVSELNRDQTGNFLYILDEPTTGLHKKDVALLIKTLNKLVALGNTVLVIEHDIDMLKAAGWIIEMGPEAGVKGGKVIFEGKMDKLAKAKTAWGEYLREKLGQTSIERAADLHL